MSWRVFRDLEDPERFVERFIVGSWAEFIRLRERLTMADEELQQRIEQLQRSNVGVRISRLIAVGRQAAETEGERTDAD